MRMKAIFLASTALVWGAVAQAQTANFDADDAVALFRDEMGFERVEVKQGLTQLKVEAIKGNIKLEVIYDRETGLIIKQEQETVEPGDDTAPGVKTRVVTKDFIDDDDEDDDNSGSGSGDDDDDEDDDNSGPGNSDDDDDDRDDDNSGPGNSDDDDDDRDDDNSGPGNSDDDDDDGDDDNSGSGGDDDDDDESDDD